MGAVDRPYRDLEHVATYPAMNRWAINTASLPGLLRAINPEIDLGEDVVAGLDLLEEVEVFG